MVAWLIVLIKHARQGYGVEVSHDDVVIMEVKNKVKVRCEIRGTTGYRGDLNFMNVDEDIVDSGCNGEVISDGEVMWGESERIWTKGMKWWMKVTNLPQPMSQGRS